MAEIRERTEVVTEVEVEVETEVEVREGAREREWYIRLENLYLNDSFMGYKRIVTYYDHQLIDTIMAYYGLPSDLRNHIQLWSNPFRNQRLDVESIPAEYDFISVYVF